MARKSSSRKCPVCGEAGVKKNGKTRKGVTRYRCTRCGASYCQTRPDITRKAQLDKFAQWIIGKLSISEVTSQSRMTWSRQNDWCWRVEPRIPVTGEVYDEIQVDGTYLPYEWCLLTAMSRGKVLAWQWCNRENKSAYRALFKRLPPPLMVITDGQRGALSAIAAEWPDARIQRCLVHIKRNIRVLTTSKPRIPAHKALLGLAKQLVKIRTLDEADQWVNLLQQFHNQWGEWLKEETHRCEVLPENIPSWVKPNQQWWYTHQNARQAYNLLARQLREGTLFTFLDPDLNKQTTQPLTSSTNPLEGGINAQIKAVIQLHRGLSENHMRRAVEWWCYLHSENPLQPHELTQSKHLNPQPKPEIKEPKPGPAEWDIGIDLTRTDYHPDISIRKGWADHSH